MFNISFLLNYYYKFFSIKFHKTDPRSVKAKNHMTWPLWLALWISSIQKSHIKDSNLRAAVFGKRPWKFYIYIYPKRLTVHSGYTFVSSPSWELRTVSPRGRHGERRQRDLCLKHTYIKTPLVGRRQPMTSLPARPQYKGRRENTSFSSSSSLTGLFEVCILVGIHFSLYYHGEH